jgi:hypothetical protein
MVFFGNGRDGSREKSQNARDFERRRWLPEPGRCLRRTEIRSPAFEWTVLAGDQTGCIGAIVAGGTRNVRIGSYRFRAVALAYLRSKRFERKLGAWQRWIEETRRKGDVAAVASIEKKMKVQQARGHIQVFGDAPVPDILADLEDHEAVKKDYRRLAANPDVAMIRGSLPMNGNRPPKVRRSVRQAR